MRVNKAISLRTPLARNKKGIIHLLPLLVLAIIVGGIFVAVKVAKQQQDLRVKAELPTDGLPCTLPPGSLPPGLCTGFNGVEGAAMEPAQKLTDQEWDTRIAQRSFEQVHQNSVNMNTGCNAIGLRTFSDPNMMAMVCGNHMMTHVDGGANWWTMRSRPMFDFTNRTGKLFFTVDLNFAGRNWMEVWITPDKLRYPGTPIFGDTGDVEVPRNALLIRFDNDDCDLEEITYLTSRRIAGGSCQPPRQDNARNKVVIELSTTHIKMTINDIVYKDHPINPPLAFSKGHVMFQHIAYSPDKDLQPAETAHWDSVGFDGSVSSFAVAGTTQEKSWIMSQNQTPKLVTLNHPTGGNGLLWFSAEGIDGSGNAQYRLNGGVWKTITPQQVGSDWHQRAFTFPETFAKGDNTIEFRSTGSSSRGGAFSIHRIDLEVPLTGSLPTSTPQPTPTPPEITPTLRPTPTLTPTPVPTPTRTPSPSPTPTPCVKLGDMDGDCDIDITDLSIFLNRYDTKHSSADLNGDGQVTIADLSVFLSRFGQ